MAIERYIHHGAEVTVQSHLKGKHREHCLCFQGCSKFPEGGTPPDMVAGLELAIREMRDELEEGVKADGLNICPRAAILYAYCRVFGMTTPVFECGEFESTQPSEPQANENAQE